MTAEKRGVVKFSRTEEAAKTDKQSKWVLIEAIREDAIENGLPIVGIDSRVAAKRAFEDVGDEYSDSTISHLCLVAKFDHESAPYERKVWRRYGWTIVRRVAAAGITPTAAADMLGGPRKSRREVDALLDRYVSRDTRRPGRGAVPINEALHRWLTRLDALLTEGAALAERAETEGNDLGAHAEMALLIYDRITEKKLDAELRAFLQEEALS